MKLGAFQHLDQHTQLAVAMRKGVYLMEYTKYNVIVRLFQVGRFYAEIYSRNDDDEVIMIHGFEDMRYLEPYLEQLELPALF